MNSLLTRLWRMGNATVHIENQFTLSELLIIMHSMLPGSHSAPHSLVIPLSTLGDLPLLHYTSMATAHFHNLTELLAEDLVSRPLGGASNNVGGRARRQRALRFQLPNVAGTDGNLAAFQVGLGQSSRTHHCGEERCFTSLHYCTPSLDRATGPGQSAQGRPGLAGGVGHDM